jgi:hypothetical protein
MHAKFEVEGKPKSTRKLRCPEPLFVGIKAFIKVVTRRDAFLICVHPSPNLNHIHMKFLPSNKEFKDVFEKKLQTPCPNIDHMIAPLILWKECNLHLDSFIIVTRRTCSTS